MSKPNKRKSSILADVLYDFPAGQSDELEAKAGEVLTILAFYGNDWLVAKSEIRPGPPGIIPSNYKRLFRDYDVKRPTSDLSTFLIENDVPTLEQWKLKQRRSHPRTSNEAVRNASNADARAIRAEQRGMDAPSRMGKTENPAFPSRNGSATPAPSQSELFPITTNANVSKVPLRVFPKHTSPDMQDQFSPEKHRKVESPSPSKRMQAFTRTVKPTAPLHSSTHIQSFDLTATFDQVEPVYAIHSVLNDGTHCETKKVYNDFYILNLELISLLTNEQLSYHPRNLLDSFQLPPASEMEDPSLVQKIKDYLNHLMQLPDTISASPHLQDFFKYNGASYEKSVAKVKLKIRVMDFPLLKLSCDPFNTTLKSLGSKIKKQCFPENPHMMINIFLEANADSHLPISTDEHLRRLLLNNKALSFVVK